MSCMLYGKLRNWRVRETRAGEGALVVSGECGGVRAFGPGRVTA